MHTVTKEMQNKAILSQLTEDINGIEDNGSKFKILCMIAWILVEILRQIMNLKVDVVVNNTSTNGGVMDCNNNGD